jgi:hypothetical protein
LNLPRIKFNYPCLSASTSVKVFKFFLKLAISCAALL